MGRLIWELLPHPAAQHTHQHRLCVWGWVGVGGGVCASRHTSVSVCSSHAWGLSWVHASCRPAAPQHCPLSRRLSGCCRAPPNGRAHACPNSIAPVQSLDSVHAAPGSQPPARAQHHTSSGCDRAALCAAPPGSMDREPLRDTDAYMRASGSTFFQDENSAAASSFAELSQAFNQRITELQQLMCLRIEGEKGLSVVAGAWRAWRVGGQGPRRRSGAPTAARGAGSSFVRCDLRRRLTLPPPAHSPQITPSTCSWRTCRGSRCGRPVAPCAWSTAVCCSACAQLQC